MDRCWEENVYACWEQRLSLSFSLAVSLFLDRAHCVLCGFTEAQSAHTQSAGCRHTSPLSFITSSAKPCLLRALGTFLNQPLSACCSKPSQPLFFLPVALHIPPLSLISCLYPQGLAQCLAQG